MANHLTPSELARESGLERRDVIVKCVELGVPIFNGRDRQDPLPLQPARVLRLRSSSLRPLARRRAVS